MLKPNYVFEASWEVCNRVGGIYTVLSTKAASMVKDLDDHLLFLGPDVWHESASPFFISCGTPYDDWAEEAKKESLFVRVGRWNIPGRPIVILVDFSPFYEYKNRIYAEMWESAHVDSLHAYGDYDESSMFGYACGRVVESFVNYYKLGNKKVIAHFDEWMTAFGGLYLRSHQPSIATVFTTHATSMGRSIAGNNKPLYDYLYAYNGDQMARELNMEAKHSVEKQAVHLSDCFTTVSEVTSRECTQLLEKTPDVVTPNGFENGFVPQGAAYTRKRNEARRSLRRVTEKMLGYELSKDALFIGTSGRYEFKNKGIDVFIEAMRRVAERNLNRDIVALIVVPANTENYRIELTENSPVLCEGQLYSTHKLYDESNDAILGSIRWHGFTNSKDSHLKIVFIPSYLNGDDGIFNKSYYDVLIGLDLTIFPSYYEPWGYTPLESAAFGIPTITTNLSGFGQWALSENKQKDNMSLESGLGVVARTDYNYHDVVYAVAEMVCSFAAMKATDVKQIGTRVRELAQKALWTNFIKFYDKAYDIALHNRNNRLKTK